MSDRLQLANNKDDDYFLNMCELTSVHLTLRYSANDVGTRIILV